MNEEIALARDLQELDETHLGWDAELRMWGAIRRIQTLTTDGLNTCMTIYGIDMTQRALLSLLDNWPVGARIQEKISELLGVLDRKS